jgi:MFS family permease
VDRRDAVVLLAVCSVAVFLSGVELMVTAVALPAIVTDLADWGELRRASWIINGYLLVAIATMPLAGRLADHHGIRPLLLGGLALFTLGSFVAGAAPSLDLLIAARFIQAAGAGTLVPVATAAAAHLYDGHARPRALGIVGAATFLGMAAGPFVGAAILRLVHPEAALESLGADGDGTLAALITPAWRWVFYLNVPIGVAALALAWAAAAGWETPRRAGRIDLPGAVTFTGGLAALLLGLTLLGETTTTISTDPTILVAALLALGALGLVGAVLLDLRRREPFLDIRAFRHPGYAGAAIVSLLTGYGFATAIIGAAVVVDRVLYGGPGDQQVALGALALATAIGALVSGWLVRRLPLGLLTIGGLVASAAALLLMATWDPATRLETMAGALALFGIGFGVTVTPRSTAATEAVGAAAFGAASATVTVARMIGMAIGLAVLTAYGSTTIDRLTAQVFATPEAYQALLPLELVGRPFNDGLVVEALEAWAATEAARILGGIFVVAAIVTLAAIPAALAMGRRPRILTATGDGPAQEAPGGREGGDDHGGREPGSEPTLAL